MAEDQAAGMPPSAGNTILALGAGAAGPEPAAAPGMGMGQHVLELGIGGREVSKCSDVSFVSVHDDLDRSDAVCARGSQIARYLGSIRELVSRDACHVVRGDVLVLGVARMRRRRRRLPAPCLRE